MSFPPPRARVATCALARSHVMLMHARLVSEPPPAIHWSLALIAEGLNYNTLFMPIKIKQLASEPQLSALLSELLERDATWRLGASKYVPVRESAFFQSVEWDLLLAQRLPAPWCPDPNLVYAKDFIAPHSFEAPQLPEQPAAAPGSAAHMQLQAQTTELGVKSSWNYECDPDAFGNELAEYAFKVPVQSICQRSSPGWQAHLGWTALKSRIGLQLWEVYYGEARE